VLFRFVAAVKRQRQVFFTEKRIDEGREITINKQVHVTGCTIQDDFLCCMLL
jgi:hypothetical protein